jgi:integrase
LSPWLFPNAQGERRSIGGFGAQIADFIFEETGLRMNPHLIRHAAAKLYLAAYPEDIETVRQLLGHKSINTTLRAYVEFKSGIAYKTFDALIERLRQEVPVLRPRSGPGEDA